MAETSLKRPTEESFQDSDTHNESEDSKRHKPYNNSNTDVLNFLDEEEDDAEPSHDLTAIFTTLQQEISSSSSSTATTALAADLEDTHDPTAECRGDEHETAKSVIRHLLEASDDELGIPNQREDDDNNNNNHNHNHNHNNNNLEILNAGENFLYDFSDDGGLWDLEDEAANYYTVL